MTLDVTWGQGWALAASGAFLIAVYCYTVVKPARAGLPRLLLSIPALLANVCLPWIFRQQDQILGVAVMYCITAWISSFKLLCFCWNTGVLSSPWISSDVFRFVAALSLPIHIQPKSKDARAESSSKSHRKKSAVLLLLDALESETWSMLLIRSSIKLVVFNYLMKLMSYLEGVSLFLMHVVFSCTLFLFVTIVCETLAGVAAAFLDIEILPHFNHPYFATSFQELWSRRWNITVSSCLRETIFEPVKFAVLWLTSPGKAGSPAEAAAATAVAAAAASIPAPAKADETESRELLVGKDSHMQNGERRNGEKQNGAVPNSVLHSGSGLETQRLVEGVVSEKAELARSRQAKLVGMLATFFVSGLAHEFAVWYMSNRVTGEMTLFFTLHGVISATECFLIRQWMGKGGKSTMQGAEQSNTARSDKQQHNSRDAAAGAWKEVKGGLTELLGWKNVAAWLFVVGSSLVSAHFLFFGPLTRLGISHEVLREVRAALRHS